MHMGVMGFTVKEFLKRVPAERLRDGDVWFLNLPEVGGNHLPDVKAVRPVFVERPAGRLRHQPRPLGGHRRRRAGQLRALGDRVLPGGPADRAACASSRRGGARTRDDRPHPRQPARARGARGRYLRPVRRQRRRRAPARRALSRTTAPRRSTPASSASTTSPRRRCARRIRALPDGVVGGRGLARRRRRRRPAASASACASTIAGRRGHASTSRGTDAAGPRAR